MNEFSVILRSLLRSRAAMVLTAIQVALTLAVLVNAFASGNGYRRMIGQSMGIPEARLVATTSEYIEIDGAAENVDKTAFHKARIQRDLELLQRVPGVQKVTVTNGFPLSDAVPVRALRQNRDDKTSQSATFFTGDANFVSALDLKLVAGRDFTPDEVVYSADPNISDGAAVAIVSQALADKLYPDGSAMNKQFIAGERALTIVGIVQRLPGLHPLWSNVELSYVVPGVRSQALSRFLVLTEEGAANQAVPAIEGALFQAHPESVLTVETFGDIKQRTLSDAMSTLWILGFVTIMLLVVTGLGCYGQTTFTVTRRTREIGIRRAIGATKGQVLSYFLIENWIMTTVGVVVGLLLTYALNIVLVQGLGATKVSMLLILPCIAFLWLLGLSSALLPALRATAVPPATATRSI